MRRRFFSAEKRQILADACKKPGELGALLRRKRIYSSMPATWRKQRDRAAEAALTPRRRGRKPDPKGAERQRIAQLERKTAQLEREPAQACLIIDVQSKVSALLGISMADSTEEE